MLNLGEIRSGFSFGYNRMICVYTEHTGQIEKRSGYGSVGPNAVCLVSRDSSSAYREARASGCACYI